MNSTPTGGSPARRGIARLTASVLAAAGLAATGTTAAAPAAHAAEVPVTGASLTWAISGYAQKGIFGPWRIKDLTGDAGQLYGTVTEPLPAGASYQTEYVVAPVPVTSMPANAGTQKTPNAVKFTAGTGTRDDATGAVDLTWDGSYTVNAYPAVYNAPDEIYSDPELTLDEDGDGELTMHLGLGAGADMQGNPTPAQDLGRVTLLEFDAGSVAATGLGSFRATPDYQGSTVTIPEGGAPQATSCSTGGGATGWWGAWPQAFVTAIPAFVRPHFYSTGCGGNQDLKPPLPVDVDLGLEPAVSVSDDTLLPDGQHAVTVTGRNFDPALATGTRPPFAGLASGVYVAFGRFSDNWRPSVPGSGGRNLAPTEHRNGVSVIWAVPAASFAASNPPQSASNPSYTVLGTDGSFSTTVHVDRSWLAEAEGTFGIYTYAGGGANVAAYETFTPLSFEKAASSTSLGAPARVFGQAATATVTVAGGAEVSGEVQLKRGASVVGSAPLVGGTASFALGRLGVGDHPLTATYAGTGNLEASSATTTLRVARATTRTAVTVARRPTPRRGGKVQVALTSPTAAPVTGRVKVVVRTAQGRKVKAATKALVRGTAGIALPRLARGAYRVVVTYAATADFTGSTRKATFRVR
ncbi:Ig-like domain-containing protein [Nocardioides sp. SYSU D00038]|uniref:Ig-like domain-containing protein n=1 Tax=Nocardioides sp. SYSU D00038 TaxID=2812554 RepID=UPI0019681FC0|nr:Ig-like domain-containing protein [Nocardioides sp. SYSU D00038]